MFHRYSPYEINLSEEEKRKDMRVRLVEYTRHRKPNDDVRNPTPKAESEIAQKQAKRI
jgi:hypothetical protein